MKNSVSIKRYSIKKKKYNKENSFKECTLFIKKRRYYVFYEFYNKVFKKIPSTLQYLRKVY